MHVYDTLIIGSGYSSMGYALKKENCIILEETQCCDAHFYLPLKSFIFTAYTPKTELGIKLNSVFEKYNLFKDGFMCLNAFESAFCEFISGENIEIILKSKVIGYEKTDDNIFKITAVSSEGLCTFYAKNIIDSKGKEADKYITVLFATENGADAIEKLSKIFTDGTFTKAFYENRFAMHLPAKNIDNINEMLSIIEEKWKMANTDAKVLYVAPVFATAPNKNNDNFPKDFNFENPIEAFEAGVFLAGGDK